MSTGTIKVIRGKMVHIVLTPAQVRTACEALQWAATECVGRSAAAERRGTVYARLPRCVSDTDVGALIAADSYAADARRYDALLWDIARAAQAAEQDGGCC